MSFNLSNSQNNQDALFEIKNRLDIVDVVSEHVVLKKSGRNFWGLCPFHKEKTPSFSVNPDKGIYKCFGCGEGGDAISFLMKVNNESFFEVLSELAQKYNIQLPTNGNYSEKAELRNSICEINASAVKYYKNLLLTNPNAQKAKEYLNNRGITDDIIDKFNLGYSLKQPDGLINHLMEKIKPNFELLEKAGLTSKKSTGGHCDRFRHRIMIPIQDDKGNFIAFGARALDDSQNPKYLNSPDTPVFNKSRSLFALDQAKDSIKNSDSVLVMEGYFDVISAHAHGLTNVVATLGTALTEQHLKILAKFTQSRRIYLAFDADNAGVSATNRGAEIIKNVFEGLGEIKQFDENFSATSDDISSRTSCEIRVVSTNTEKDPDEFIRNEGIEAYKDLIKKAPLLIDYQINSIIKSKNEITNPQEKAQLAKKLIPILSEIKNSIIRDEYVDIVAKKLGINTDSLATEVKKSSHNLTSSKKVKINQIINKKSEKHLLVQKNLLSLYFMDSDKLSNSCINNYLKEVNFTNPEFLLIKSKLETLINKSENTENLINLLMAELADNDKAKQTVVDMIVSLDSIKDLDERHLNEYILENIQCANQCQAFIEKNKLKDDYHSAEDDEIRALQLQYKVRELVEQSKYRLETINDQKI